MSILTSLKDIPFETASWVNNKVSEEKIILKLVKPRKRKLGDYRFFPEHNQHQITINNDLSENLFLLTFIHELAHKRTFEKHGRNVKPHGIQWKKCFQIMLIEGLEVSESLTVKKTLIESIDNPKACIHIKDVNYKGLTVVDLKLNDTFIVTYSSEKFILKKKRRTRYSCIKIRDGKQYSISADAHVTKCN
jgi:SprT protein